MPSIQPKKLTGAGIIRGLGYMLLLASILFLTDGLVRLNRENVESTEWPAVQASLLGCNLQHHDSLNRHAQVSYYTVCKFRYTANNQVFESSTRTTPTQSNGMVSRMEAWIKEHPKGSVETIHYNPSQPQEISLAGSDSEIQTFSAAVQLRAAIVLAVAGLFFLVLAFVLSKNKLSADSSTNSASLMVNGGLQ